MTTLRHRRGALVLAAFIAQLGLPLAILLKAPFSWGPCPLSAAMQEQSDRFEQTVISSGAVLLVMVIAAVFWWTIGRRNRYRWEIMIFTLVPAVAIAGLTLAMAAFATMTFCGANWLLP